MAKLCADQIQIHQSAAFLVFCADLHRLQVADGMSQDGHENGRFSVNYIEALLVATVDTALVMQNVAVAAESIGLGVCMIGAIRNQPKAVGRLLELPSFVYAVSGLCIGYPADEPPSKPRLPMEAVLHRERYIDDASHRSHLEAYDQAMVAFYKSQQMHSSEPRWTRTMAGRSERFVARAELDVFLQEQGFNQKSNP